MLNPMYTQILPNATRDGKILSRKFVLPDELNAIVPDEQAFVITVDEDGIHFKPTEPVASNVELPSWARRPANGSHHAPDA
jgi:hypothetical protein